MRASAAWRRPAPPAPTPCATAPCATTSRALPRCWPTARCSTPGSAHEKSASGYDLTHLLVGSEGTLGIITELTLKLHGIPETILSAVCPFATLEGACNATIIAMQMGLPLARIELLDEVQIGPATPIRISRLPSSRRCFSSFTAAPPPRASRSRPSPRSPRSRAEGRSPGPSAPEDRSQALAGAPRRLLGGAGAAARRRGAGHRCLRADLARLPIASARPRRHRPARPARADRRPCRRRQFPRHAAVRPGRCRGEARGASFLDRLAERASPWTAPVPASTASARARCAISPQSTAPASTSMIAIKKALDPLNILNPGKIFALP